MKVTIDKYIRQSEEIELEFPIFLSHIIEESVKKIYKLFDDGSYFVVEKTQYRTFSEYVIGCGRDFNMKSLGNYMREGESSQAVTTETEYVSMLAHAQTALSTALKGHETTAPTGG